MSVISSNSLFHFTSSAESLIGILKNSFHPKYFYESYSFSVNSDHSAIEAGIPMICFCDLPLSQIKKHLSIYGQYGLGMRKEWGKSKGLNPILYISPDSILSSSLDNLYTYLVTQRNNMALDELNSLLNLLRFTKPYDGLFKHHHKRYTKYRFYNEREWRFIPDLRPINSPPPLLIQTDYNNSVELARNNSLLENYPLTFTPNDIKYIVIKEENEITSMINSLREIKSHYSQNMIDILTSKIITAKQIKEDF